MINKPKTQTPNWPPYSSSHVTSSLFMSGQIVIHTSFPRQHNTTRSLQVDPYCFVYFYNGKLFGWILQIRSKRLGKKNRSISSSNSLIDQKVANWTSQTWRFNESWATRSTRRTCLQTKQILRRNSPKRAIFNV